MNKTQAAPLGGSFPGRCDSTVHPGVLVGQVTELQGPVSLYAAVRIIWTAMWFPAFDGVIADPLTLLQTPKRMGRPVVVNVLFLDANPKD